MNTTPATELGERTEEMLREIVTGVRIAVLTSAADEIEALPQDYECDPGRGDAVKLLRERAQGTGPLTVTASWAGSVSFPDGNALTQKAVIDCQHISQGIKVALVVKAEDRIKLASLLDAELRDPYAKCLTPGCGSDHDLDTSDVVGWIRIAVAGTEDEDVFRWYCTPICVSHALTRAGDELAAADRRAELDGGL